MSYLHFSVVFIISVITSFVDLKIVNINESSICRIKKSCVECLQLDHCSWCPSTNKCFLENSSNQAFCNETLKSAKYDLSLLENAECSCGVGQVDNCRPVGITDGPACHGRGSCICGKCFCDPVPDPQNPSKMIMGEYCEFDNFSCDGPKCNEGPYSINEVHLYEKNNADDLSDIDVPIEQ